MNTLKTCGYCGHKPAVSTYFNLRTGDVSYHVECPYCHHNEVIASDQEEAINKWNYLFPTLFTFE